MPLITRNRETRRWLVAAAVYAAILSTLTIAPDVADALREQGAVDAVFGAGSLLVLMAIMLRVVRPSQVVIVVGLVAVAILGAVRLTADLERTHLVEYAVLAIAIDAALDARVAAGRTVPAHHWSALAVTSALGAVDEAVQAALPQRVFDARDIAFNAGAAAAAIAIPVAARRLGRPDQGRRSPRASARSRAVWRDKR